MGETTDQITRLLGRWRAGEEQARDALIPLIYERLRTLAEREFHSERGDHTLQPTALVNEAFLQLDRADVDFNDRRHFYSLAARTMRRLLVDHARSKRRDKRGGDRVRVQLNEIDLTGEGPTADMLDLTDALEELEGLNARVSLAMELMYFGGLNRQEVAEQLEISPTTLDRDLRMGRAWLKRRLG